jgi:hypothetical protein
VESISLVAGSKWVTSRKSQVAGKALAHGSWLMAHGKRLGRECNNHPLFTKARHCHCELEYGARSDSTHGSSPNADSSTLDGDETLFQFFTLRTNQVYYTFKDLGFNRGRIT